MRPIRFVKCVRDLSVFNITKNKIYFCDDYSETANGDYYIQIVDDLGFRCDFFMGMAKQISANNLHLFDFITLPEFPESVEQWTENDWFQYDLKYGE